MRTAPHEVHHFSCFVCSVCRRPIATGEPYTRDKTTGALLCKADYLMRKNQPADGGLETTAVPATSDSQQNLQQTHTPFQHFENGSAGGKRGRTTLSPEQRIQLQKVFEENPRPPRKVVLLPPLKRSKVVFGGRVGALFRRDRGSTLTPLKARHATGHRAENTHSVVVPAPNFINTWADDRLGILFDSFGLNTSLTEFTTSRMGDLTVIGRFSVECLC